MKRKEHNIYLIRAFVAVFMTVALTACVGERLDINTHFGQDGRLSLKGTVSEATVATRAEAIADLQEKQLNTLDVFVEHVTGTTGDGTFIKQYHLTSGILEADLNWLADNWRNEGLQMGQKYNIYVAANNTQTSGTKDLATFNVAALEALVADEVTDGIAVIVDGNVARVDGKTTGNIYKLYNANPGDHRALTNEKEFMMAGVIKNWTPDAANLDQVFDVKLDRAASKFVVKVNFDADFLKSLTHTKKIVDGVETWVEKPAAEQITITGTPAWKFLNFSFGAPVFEPATQGNGVEVHNSGFNIFHTDGYAGDDKNFTIITYSYPNKWAEADYAAKAPSLVVSVEFTQNGAKSYHYYRIPLVKSTVTAIERNHIYSIKATIATKGSAIQEDQDVTEDIQYAVLPWNDKTNSVVIENNVQSVPHYYFNVNPKVYTLRGDGDQSVILNYLKASGTKVNWKLFTYDQNGNQTGVVAKNNANARRAWFYDADGDFTTTYNDNSGVDWSNSGSTPMGVSIVQSTEGTSGSKGTVTITSTALNNKAIKYIRLRVYLDEEATFDDSGNETMYEDIIIRHFPTDNIQNVEGLWSSYHDPDAASSTTIYKTTSLAEAQSLAEQYGISFTSEELTETEYINYTTYSQHAGEAGYSMVGPQTITRQQFSQAVTNNENRRNANSQANARLVDQWYYWGENPSTTNNQNQADYYTGGWFTGYTYYAYQNRYRAQYTHEYTYTEYTLELPIASTGNWVNWAAEDRANHPNQRTRAINYTNNGSQFIAKVFDGGTIYYINETQGGSYWSGYYYSTERGSNSGLTNNHMYVIQISSTSEEYVLGRPFVNQSTHQSQDDVVSPAFMIASQLGAVLPFTGDNGPANAATHCSRYMEVTADGTYYTGWRLPTASEISVITSYQYGNIGGVTIPSQYQAITPVLTGMYYHSLSGEDILANPNADAQSQTKSYLRCVRDLSASEIEALNGFDKIQEKYR